VGQRKGGKGDKVAGDDKFLGGKKSLEMLKTS